MAQQVLWFRSEKTGGTAKWVTDCRSESFPEIWAKMHDEEAVTSDSGGVLEVIANSLKWEHVLGIVLEEGHKYKDTLNKYEHRLHPNSRN